MELCDMTAVELGRLLRNREITSKEVTLSALKRIQETEGKVHAFITVTEDVALEMADRADARFRAGEKVSSLTGIPLAVKDLLCTEGIRTTCGSKMLADYVPPYSATAVRRVLEAGAVLVGKTNMDEFAMGSSTENSAFGPTRNPVDLDRVPGGSSGGSAAALAAGESVLSLGSDTGGSIRLPAAFCGVVGLKPTYGRVSRYGLVAYASSLDQVGPMARTVEDCAILLQAISGYDRRDTTSAEVVKPDVRDYLDRGVEGLRIGLPEEYFVEGLDSAIREKILSAAQLLERNGARIIQVSLPHTAYAIGTYYLIATAEASSNLARYDGVKYGLRTEAEVADVVQMYEMTRNEGFGEEVKRRIMLGTYVLSAGYYEAYYLKAQKVRALIKQDFDRALEQVDCMLAPVSPCLPFLLGEKMADPLQMYLVDVYTVSLNLAGVPGLSVPCGVANDLPVGMQIIGRPFDEATVLGVGYAYEKLRKR